MRYSRQREAVYAALCKTKSHPDTAWIYAEVKRAMPKISLATVYRNLAELEELGKIKKVSAEGYTERYDANMSAHAHLVCGQCGAIVDVDAGDINVYHNIDGVSRCEVTLYGMCDKCRKNIKGGKLQ